MNSLNPGTGWVFVTATKEHCVKPLLGHTRDMTAATTFHPGVLLGLPWGSLGQVLIKTTQEDTCCRQAQTDTPIATPSKQSLAGLRAQPLGLPR